MEMKRGIIIIIFLVLLFSISAIKSQNSNTTANVGVNPIYGLFLDINTYDIFQGENLTVLIKLNKTGVGGEIAVNLDYEVSNSSNNIINGSLESINVSNYIEKNITIELPNNIELGNHSIEITASHHQALGDSDADYFLVKSLKCGDLNYDGILDVFDVVLLVNVAFRGASPPSPSWIADINGDGIISDVFDVVGLINHVFRGGDEPTCRQENITVKKNFRISVFSLFFK